MANSKTWPEPKPVGALPFTAVSLGGDMCSYGVARAFYEEYGIKSIILGRSPLYPSAYSRITEGYYYPDLMEDDVLIEALTKIQQDYPGIKKFLFGNMDFYVRHLVHNRARIEAISDDYILPMVDEEKFDQLFDKDSFYGLCEQYGLPYPKSVRFDCKDGDPAAFTVPFEYPVFAKPANTVGYADYKAKGLQKGYKIDSQEQLRETLTHVKELGFPGTFIIQEYIEGSDDSMYMYTAYVNTKGKVVGMCGANILMHDRTPDLIGNYNAMTYTRDEELAEKLKTFLESVGYTGICHFDIQYDKKRDGYIIFEMNLRQGRGNYYTVAGGLNLAKCLVDDYIEGKDTPFFLTDTPYTTAVLSESALVKAVGERARALQGPDGKIENFRRLMLPPYDQSLKRKMYQRLSDKAVLDGYNKYNK